MERIHARFVSYKCNDVGFAKVTLAERRHLHTIIQVYKILNHLVPAYLQDTFMFTRDLTGFVGRNSYRLLTRMWTTYGQRSFFRGAVAWNNLNQTLYSITSLETFKLSYKLLYS